MKLFCFRNFIFGFFIAIGLFIGLNCYSSASTFKTLNLKHSSTSYNDNNHNCTVTFGTPTFTGQSVKDPNSSYTGSNYQVVYYNVIVTTSEGTFTIKSGSGSVQFSNYNTDQSFNLGLTGLGSYTLPGYFINASLEYTSGNDVYGGGIFAQENSTGYVVGEYNKKPNEVLINSVNSNFVSFSNGTYPSIDSNVNSISFEYAGSNQIVAYDPYTCYYITPNTIKFSVTNPNSDWGYNAYIFTLDGSDFCVKSESFTNSTLSVNTTFMGGYYSSRPIKMFIHLWGINSISDVTFTYQNWSFYTAPTTIKSEWDTIDNSEELEHFSNTSVSMNEIISNNNDTFNDDFSDYDNYISQVNLSGSKTSFNYLTTLPRTYLNAFYNGFNDNLKSFIRIILNIGLAMMVLTVGTRVIKHRG